MLIIVYSWAMRRMKRIHFLRYFAHPLSPFMADNVYQIDEGFSEDDLDTNLQRDKYARLCNAVNQLIDELTPSAPDFQLRDACDQLVCDFDS
jgi:hypothetical protein